MGLPIEASWKFTTKENGLHPVVLLAEKFAVGCEKTIIGAIKIKKILTLNRKDMLACILIRKIVSECAQLN